MEKASVRTGSKKILKIFCETLKWKEEKTIMHMKTHKRGEKEEKGRGMLLNFVEHGIMRTLAVNFQGRYHICTRS